MRTLTCLVALVLLLLLPRTGFTQTVIVDPTGGCSPGLHLPSGQISITNDALSAIHLDAPWRSLAWPWLLTRVMVISTPTKIAAPTTLFRRRL